MSWPISSAHSSNRSSAASCGSCPVSRPISARLRTRELGHHLVVQQHQTFPVAAGRQDAGKSLDPLAGFRAAKSRGQSRRRRPRAPRAAAARPGKWCHRAACACRTRRPGRAPAPRPPGRSRAFRHPARCAGSDAKSAAARRHAHRYAALPRSPRARRRRACGCGSRRSPRRAPPRGTRCRVPPRWRPFPARIPGRWKSRTRLPPGLRTTAASSVSGRPDRRGDRSVPARSAEVARWGQVKAHSPPAARRRGDRSIRPTDARPAEPSLVEPIDVAGGQSEGSRIGPQPKPCNSPITSSVTPCASALTARGSTSSV